MGGKKEIKWDANNDRKLFLAIMKVSNIKPDYEAVAKVMATEDCAPTGTMIANRLSKLRTMAKTVAGDEGTAEKATPRKRKKASSDNVQDHDDDEATPDKKRQLGAKPKTEMGVKKEEEGDDYGFN
ncbi:hypothetical protein LTR10_001797 [Elasticomyces elasticus]|nr:hypothetical protein LTR10_001797 [Elasticomyces elasticus]KAK4975295.1 hypothetical protein LTR42_004505 [Elasticomyces elasticus]